MVKAAKEKKSKFQRLTKRWLEIFGFISRGEAIHLKCLRCCGGNRKGPGMCEDVDCPLWAYVTSPSRLYGIGRVFHRDKVSGEFHAVATVRKRKLRGILSISERKGKTIITLEQKNENGQG